MYEPLNALKISCKFACWAMAVLNYNFAVGGHDDKLDFKDGMCCIIVFRSFLKGYLYFKDKSIFIEFNRGGIVIFKSADYWHFVTNFIGN